MCRFLIVLAELLIAGPARAAAPPKVADLVRQLETGSPGERVIADERLRDLGPHCRTAAASGTAQNSARPLDPAQSDHVACDWHPRRLKPADSCFAEASLNR